MSEIKKCSSLSYFVENYLKITNSDGSSRHLHEAELELVKKMEEAERQGGMLKRVWTRQGYNYVIIKK